MAVDIDTASDHVDLFDRLRAFLESSSSGPGWTLLRWDSQNMRALYQAPGLSGLEAIYVGISLHEDVGADTFHIGMWMFRTYNDALGDLEQPGHSGVRYLLIWNNTMPYWFVANGQRVIIAAKVSTVYVAAHAGKFLPAGTPGEYAEPYYLAANVSSTASRWSSVSENSRNFYDPGTSSALILTPNGTWQGVANITDNSGAESSANLTNYVHPFAANINDTTTLSRYRELRENVDGTYPLHDLELLGEIPSVEYYGVIDGAYAVTGFNNASENIIQVGGDDHLVIQNVFRAARYHYGAIRLT